VEICAFGLASPPTRYASHNQRDTYAHQTPLVYASRTGCPDNRHHRLTMLSSRAQQQCTHHRSQDRGWAITKFQTHKQAAKCILFEAAVSNFLNNCCSCLRLSTRVEECSLEAAILDSEKRAGPVREQLPSRQYRERLSQRHVTVYGRSLRGQTTTTPAITSAVCASWSSATINLIQPLLPCTYG
jgi:hypothetical protein